eukprot:11780793-Alexandrium_andersonii.AAC.1
MGAALGLWGSTRGVCVCVRARARISRVAQHVVNVFVLCLCGRHASRKHLPVLAERTLCVRQAQR